MQPPAQPSLAALERLASRPPRVSHSFLQHEVERALGNRTLSAEDAHMRREYVVAGEPLRQLSEAEQQASNGELVVSPQAWEMIRNDCVGRRLAHTPPFGDGYVVVTRCSQPPPLRVHPPMRLKTS